MWFEQIQAVVITLVLAVPFVVVGTLLVIIYGVLRIEVLPHLEVLATDHVLYPLVNQYFRTVEVGLAEEGFSAVGKYYAPTAVTGGESLYLLLLNPARRDMALASATFVRQGGGRRLRMSFLELQSEFEDDSSINTVNLEEPHPFRHLPQILSVQLPSILDPRILYRLHGLIVLEQARGRRKLWKWKDDPREDLRKDLGMAYTRLADQGYLKLAADGAHYRVTLKGCMSALSKIIWPFSMVARGRIHREERRILKELGHQDEEY
jgi:hypothetical protein